MRSLVISYSLGVVLTFFTVTFSSWRVSYINIVRAIRDIPEPSQPKPQWGSQGFLTTVIGLVFRPTDRAGWLRRGAGVVALVLAGLGFAFWPLLVVSGLIVVGIFASYAMSQATLPPLLKAAVFLGAFLTTPLSLVAGVFMTLQLGPLFLIGGLAMIAIAGNSAFLLLFGLSLTPLGLALLVRSFGANERITYTLTGLFLIYIWEFDFSVGLLERIFGEAEGDIEMFFLSGVMVTVAATFLVVYNADLILGPLSRAGRGLGALLPSLKMAIAYPLANRMRTGMTMAMFCLVVFALTVMSSMNHNFQQLFLSDQALGGWQITVDENPTNPISDLRADLATANSPALDSIEAVGVVSIVTMREGRLCQVTPNRSCQPSGNAPAGFSDYQIRGIDQTFIEESELLLQARASGYGSDRAVWNAVASDPRLAVIDSFALGGDFGTAPVITGVNPGSQAIEPITLVIRNPVSGTTETVQVIGIISMGASATYTGLHVQQSTLEAVYGQPDSRRFFVKTASGSDNREVAREIESALLLTGAQAESLRYQVDRQNAAFSGFFYLMQGFMGLGLLVGVAAVGVIAFRTVVERRQQIGMLRAIGYTRRMIGLTFMIESAFIAFMGILSGVVFALILARQLITDEFANQGATSFAIPWPQVLLIAGLAFGFALLMTLIPSRQAANIPIAQALRYE
jgi:putative ABC transport system permease protein